MGMWAFICFSLAFMSVEAHSCPEGWTLIGDQCYQISQNGMDWYQAQEYCCGKNGALAEVKTEKQQSILGEILPYDEDFWFGLNDMKAWNILTGLPTNQTISMMMKTAFIWKAKNNFNGMMPLVVLKVLIINTMHFVNSMNIRNINKSFL